MINQIIILVIMYDATLQETIAVVGKDSTKVNKDAEDLFIHKIKSHSPEYADHMRTSILDDGYFANNDGWEFMLTHPEVKEV